MKIGLIDVDGHNFPNLALMKLSAFHKAEGDDVEWYSPFEERYDLVYMAKVFTHTPDYGYYVHADRIERGGTGYDLNKNLPDEVDRMQPDYSLYPTIDDKTAYGFLTRGCPNKCGWCIVPKKEGAVRPYMDVDDIAIDGRDHLVLMDNNILASDYGIRQLEKIAERGYRVDFNQGLDARLVTKDVATLLASIKWIRFIRFGCDTPKQVDECDRASALIDEAGYKGAYFLYCMLHGDINECLQRVNHWRNRGNRFSPHCQPYLNFSSKHQDIPQWQKDMAHWVDKKSCFRSCEFKDFEPRKDFKCAEYF